MTNEALIAKYDPRNAQHLTVLEIEALATLTDEQIRVLAKAYPNTPQGAYLILYDNAITDPKKQLFPLSTWQNLHNVRVGSGFKNLVPFNFKSRMPRRAAPARPRTLSMKQLLSQPKKVTYDLTATDAVKLLREALATQPPAPVKELIPNPTVASTQPLEDKTVVNEDLTAKVQPAAVTKPEDQPAKVAPVPKSTPAKPVPAAATTKKTAPKAGTKPVPPDQQFSDGGEQ